MTHAHAPLLYDRLAPYFREAFTPREAWRVGIEVEKSGIDAQTGRPIPFRGPEASVESVLRGLLRLRGGRPVFEGDALVGVDAPWGSISLEPGGQVEWSSRPVSDLLELEATLRWYHSFQSKAPYDWAIAVLAAVIALER